MTDILLCPVKNGSFDPFASTLGIKLGHYTVYWVSHGNLVCVKLEWGLNQQPANTGVQDPDSHTYSNISHSEVVVKAEWAALEIIALCGLAEKLQKLKKNLLSLDWLTHRPRDNRAGAYSAAGSIFHTGWEHKIKMSKKHQGLWLTMSRGLSGIICCCYGEQ